MNILRRNHIHDSDKTVKHLARNELLITQSDVSIIEITKAQYRGIIDYLNDSLQEEFLIYISGFIDKTKFAARTRCFKSLGIDSHQVTFPNQP